MGRTMATSLAMIVIILSMQRCKTSLGSEVIYKDYEVQKGSFNGGHGIRGGVHKSYGQYSGAGVDESVENPLSFMCNSVDDCEGGWDEDCLNPEISKLGKIVISGGESKVRGVYTLENEETCGLFYRRFDGLGYIRFESLVYMWSTWS